MSTSSPRAFRAVVDSGCLPALVAATASDDAQAQCFAAGAIGESSFSDAQPLFCCIRYVMLERPCWDVWLLPVAMSKHWGQGLQHVG